MNIADFLASWPHFTYISRKYFQIWVGHTPRCVSPPPLPLLPPWPKIELSVQGSFLNEYC